MIILDTNVISEPMRSHPDKTVMGWLDGQVAESLFVTTTTLAELFAGVEMLPDGKRKSGMGEQLDHLINRLFSNRILSFDHVAALNYARLMNNARKSGYVVSMGDGQIAAIALAHGFSIATRDVKPFTAAGLTVINPWDALSGTL